MNIRDAARGNGEARPLVNVRDTHRRNGEAQPLVTGRTAARMLQRLCLPSFPCAIVALALPLFASAQTFNARPGVWETTVTTSGVSVPPELLAKMPPDRRALVEQKLAAIGAGQAQVRKSCVKQADLQKGFAPLPHDGCTVRTVSRSSTKIVMATTCTTPVQSTGNMTWEAKTPESVVGVIDQDASGRKIHVDVASKWLGADCKGVEPLR